MGNLLDAGNSSGLASRILNLENRVRSQERALEMLGIVFCAHCGKPHRRSGDSEVHSTWTLLEKITGELLTVCMDDPVAARCYLAMLNKQEEDSDGVMKRVQYVRVASQLAMWVLESHAYLPTSQYRGFVQSVMAGESIIESEDFAFNLAYFRFMHKKLPDVDSVCHLIRMCGWEMDDAESEALLLKCLNFAKLRNHPTQVAAFTKEITKPAGMFGGLMAS